VRFGAAVLGLLFAGFAMNLHSASSRIPRGVRLRSAAAVVQDEQTGELLLEKKADVAMPIASITKLMTAMVVLDGQLDMDESLTIERDDKDTLRHSRSRLPVGTRLTRLQAMLVGLMASENRAAHALGRTFPGGVGALVAAMNEKARVLGLTETTFVDPTGLSDGNLSSAKDLARLVEAARRYPQICSFSTQPEWTMQARRRQLRFTNTNALVRNPRWTIGLSKTGYIEEGGRCLVMQTQLGRRSLLIVLLNSSGKYTHFADAARIKQWIEGSALASREGSKPPHAKVVHADEAALPDPDRGRLREFGPDR
jgi:D-alanyl-D-alanine endopeptidase (penicillin-binding protein 7)